MVCRDAGHSPRSDRQHDDTRLADCSQHGLTIWRDDPTIILNVATKKVNASTTYFHRGWRGCLNDGACLYNNVTRRPRVVGKSSRIEDSIVTGHRIRLLLGDYRHKLAVRESGRCSHR